MKKYLFLSLCLFLILGISAQQDKDKEWSRWSIAVEGGVNRFDGDVVHEKGYTSDVVPGAKTKLTLGGMLEYNLTPIWSLGVDYYHLPLSGAGRYYSFETLMHNASFFTSFNLTKAFFENSETKWGLHANLGLGYSWHTINYQTNTDNAWRDAEKLGNLDSYMREHGDPQVSGAAGVRYDDWDVNDVKGHAMVVPMSLLLEYNVSKSLALGLRTQFRGYNKDNIDGRIRPNANDALEMATLGLRFKLGANRKDHLRNVSVADYRGDVTRDELQHLQNQINGLVIPVDPTNRLDDLDGRLKKLENYLDIDGPDDDNDGVANSRDQEPDTPAGNQVDFWGRTIPKGGAALDPSAFIFFDFDKTNLDTEAMTAIHIVAEKLKADPSLLVEVRGFTDNMGSDGYNAGLSQRRADKVKNELINSYGIEADRIVANGKGKYNPSDVIAKYRPYRTAVFFYSK
ncbi:MAG: OmpA family protein [Paludibacteraceae bacterium]